MMPSGGLLGIGKKHNNLVSSSEIPSGTQERITLPCPNEEYLARTESSNKVLSLPKSYVELKKQTGLRKALSSINQRVGSTKQAVFSFLGRSKHSES
jgi:hypothetical protein